MNDAIESAKGIEQLGIIGVLAVIIALGIYVVIHLKKSDEKCKEQRIEDSKTWANSQIESAKERAEDAKHFGEKISVLNLALGELKGEVNAMRSLNVSATPKGKNGNSE